MKIAIYGAGAIGGYLGCELARAGTDVTMIARNRTLAAIRENGLTLHIDGETRIGRPAATDDTAKAGPQDAVIVAVKANAAPVIAPQMAPMLGPETTVVTATNGVPWWYFHEHGGALAGTRLEAVDPGGIQWQSISPERAIGCVVYPAAEAIEPGVIRHISLNRFSLGEPGGGKSDRILRLAGALKSAGFSAPVRPRIRDEIWLKLWGNLSFNPVSVLTGATLGQMANDPLVRPVIAAMMAEAQTVGEALGVSFGVTYDKRIDGAGKVGAHRTSMLQDLDAGRKMEIDALVCAVQELARLVRIDTPAIDAVAGLVKMRAQVDGLYP
ncbi:MAG: 2-dehydropantoate 2-reductase [Rhodospirillaceae bacterium]|nr:2-dehydropantoate 2-reductase [Rhodospirillaceae bacterium]MYF87433.1 2-dehydropantoate 2-reductase [Rhodospirillaceae bacterium]MYH35248.1 2-dehydropantoate 2-reductase [Rhodospirillaceae bacterium]MYK15167.1 2-dehydropantoate 2-reductase [Rhodospirillaceae bacterium]MYK58713.1 2-dehydropantoate 2-reductase [Rhodospirillaceae bacterium]